MKLYVIHHSHTDIGYTDRQEKIERYHVDFIQQAIDILNQIHNGERPEWLGFKWTCENVWQVEKFWQHSDNKAKEDFKKYVKSGEIDISGTYLNMTELIDAHVLKEKMQAATRFCEEIGKKVDSAMTADINGYAWGYSDILLEHGIENLISAIHTHHGLFPLGKKQLPFYWETPSGGKILVWNSDHYHLGNELQIAPNPIHSYTIQDEFSGAIHADPFEVAEKRIHRYVEGLKREGYPFDYVPIFVSGVVTDNAPPNAKIMDFISKWNDQHGETIEIEMSSVDEFFQVLRQDDQDIPVYRGDWNDWWADGVGSTPQAVKHFRDAQRKYSLSDKLDPEGKYGDSELVKQARDNIMLFAEHTWGYSSSVSDPYATLVSDLELRKSAYAINANEQISRNLDNILQRKGEVSIRPDQEKVYQVINPQQTKVKDTVTIRVEYWDTIEGEIYSQADNLDELIEVIDESTGEALLFQTHLSARAREIEVQVALDPSEEKLIRVKNKQAPPLRMVKNHAYIGADGVEDIVLVNDDRAIKVSNHLIETPFFKIHFDEQTGIKRIIDQNDSRDLLKDNRTYDPFVGIYERTEIKQSPTDERRRMGRNRKSISTNRFTSQLTNLEIKSKGQLYSIVEMTYQLEGTKHYAVELKVFHHLPKLSIKVKLHKDSFWEPENLYLALPFTTGEAEELFVEKTGCIIRPGIDQLPYTNKEFYLLQNGLAYVGQTKGLAIALKDTPLITMGDLKHHPIELCKENDTEHNGAPLYSWLMNNFWETNFKVDLSGFYEFDYNLYVSKEINSKEKSIDKCRTLNEGLIAFKI